MKRRKALVLATAGLVAVFALSSCSKQDTPLKAIGVKLAQLRKQPSPRPEDIFPPSFFETRDALRDWVESRLPNLAEHDGEYQFSNALNDDLKKAKLTCGSCDLSSTAFTDETGFVGEVRLTRNEGLLEVTTQLGVQCGFDETAYLYRFDDGKWQRLWDSSKATGPDSKYEPQRIDSLRITNASEHGKRSILTLSRFPGCNAERPPVFYRLWKLAGADQKPELVIDGRAVAHVSDRHAPLYARLIGDDDLLVEFEGDSIDPAIGDRLNIRHYHIDNGEVERKIPFANSPRDFVEEWLTETWDIASGLSAEGARPQLETEYKHLHHDGLTAKFVDATNYCGQRNIQDLQVQLHLLFHTPRQPEGEDVYFRVKWTPPYMFEMVAASEKPGPDCTDPDPRLDYRRLMPYR